MLPDIIHFEDIVLPKVSLKADEPLMNLRELQIRIDDANRAGAKSGWLPQGGRCAGRSQTRDNRADVAEKSARLAKGRITYADIVPGGALKDRKRKVGSCQTQSGSCRGLKSCPS